MKRISSKYSQKIYKIERKNNQRDGQNSIKGYRGRAVQEFSKKSPNYNLKRDKFRIGREKSLIKILSSMN